MLIFGLVLALVIGITLVLVGSGGSILTVPVFVYALGVDPSVATTYSPLAIAVSSSIGSIRNFALKRVKMNELVLFGVPSVITVYLPRQFLLPLVPDEFHIGNWVIHPDTVLMLLFSVLMFTSAYRMIKAAQ